jgi:hypothetical protein
MPRDFDENAVTADEIKAYLDTQDDFDLELKTFRLCRENAFYASHGRTYTDPLTRKSRQYDIRATAVRDEKMFVRFAVECKSLRKYYPLIVSCVPRVGSESFHDVIVSPDFAAIKLRDSFYREGEPVGKSKSQFGKLANGQIVSDDKEVYEKWSQAIASAEDLITQLELPQSEGYTVVMPVLLVANDTLWTVNYSQDGLRPDAPQQVKSCSYFIGKQVVTPRYTYTISHLHIFTFEGFEAFATRLTRRDWRDLFPNDPIENELRRIQSRLSKPI